MYRLNKNERIFDLCHEKWRKHRPLQKCRVLRENKIPKHYRIKQDSYHVKVMDCKTWDEMVAFMKSVSPKDGVGVMAYTLSKRAMNYYTSLKAVELGKRGIRVNALLPGSTDTGMKKEFEKMAGGQDNLVKENGGAGRLATPQEMADPLLFLNSGMAAFVSGLLLIADMGHNCEKTLGFCKNQLDVPAALKLYNTKFFQNKLKTNQ